MTIEARIKDLITPTIEALGFEVVRVRVSGTKNGRLQVMVEPDTDGPRAGQPMIVDDCAEISRALSALLDVEDPIDGPYELEVSSPGIDRPLTRPKDFVRFAGHEARVELNAPHDGRKRFQGTILDADEANVRIQCDEGEFELPFNGIHRAKLLMTDKLLAEAENMQ